MTDARRPIRRPRRLLARARPDIPTLVAYLAFAALTGVGASLEELSRLRQIMRNRWSPDPTDFTDEWAPVPRP